MKKLISLLIGCLLGLAGIALAQQPDEQQPQSKGKHAPEKAHAPQPQGGPNAAAPQERPAKQTGAMKKERGATNERAAMNQPGGEKGQKTHAGHGPVNAPETDVATNTTGKVTTEPGAGKGRKAQTHQQSANAPATGTDVSGRTAGMPTQVGKEQQQKQGGKHPLTEAGAAPPASGGVQQNAQANAAAKAKKPA